MPMDDRLYRERLIVYSLVRLCGLVIFFVGLAIIYTGLVRPGGWPRLGAIVCIVGVIAGLIAPRIQKKAWDRQDRAAGRLPPEAATKE
jgi:hypothetical protein